MSMALENFLIYTDATIGQAMALIGRNGRGIVLAVNAERQLLGTITDGDIRRAMLAGTKLETPVSALLATKAAANLEPVTALMGTSSDALLSLMRHHSVRHVPLVDKELRVTGLVTMDDLLPAPTPPMQAVIMAGGKGTRMRPFTDDVPKPMLMVGDRPLMEHIVDQLREAGIHQVNVATQYLAHKISEHFGDGRKFGVDLSYVNEDQPLGTAGALGLMAEWKDLLLVVNGDVMTQVNYQAMRTFHEEHKADMTVAVSKYDLGVPFGVVECEGAEIRHLAEKPTYSLLVNAGIYLLEPSVRAFIPHRQRFDMTDLINALLTEGRRVVSFPILEYWLDVGKPADYEQAKNDINNLGNRS